jgi:hypothetical protein
MWLAGYLDRLVVSYYAHLFISMHGNLLPMIPPSAWCLQLMTDPDAPSPSDPTMREYLHWYVLYP